MENHVVRPNARKISRQMFCRNGCGKILPPRSPKIRSRQTYCEVLFCSKACDDQYSLRAIENMVGHMKEPDALLHKIFSNDVEDSRKLYREAVASGRRY